MELSALSEARGVSGHEGPVRKLIEECVGALETRVDAMGNLLVTKGRGRTPRVMLAAHMDEVGFVVSHVEKDGLVRFKPVGGVDLRVVPAKAVLVGPNAVEGVIGAKPVHLEDPESRKKPYKMEDLFIDVGASTQDEAESMVSLGDQCTFATRFQSLRSGLLMGKALDDRAGCMVLLRLLEEDLDLELTAVFTVQEEIGLRGSTIAAYAADPEIALAVDVTPASDTPGTDPPWQATNLGKGPAITVMDAAGVYSSRLIRRLEEVAGADGIPFQYKRSVRGGTDAGRIQLARDGVPAGIVAVPARYIHSPVSLMNPSDLENTFRLMLSFLRSLEGGSLV